MRVNQACRGAILFPGDSRFWILDSRGELVVSLSNHWWGNPYAPVFKIQNLESKTGPAIPRAKGPTEIASKLGFETGRLSSSPGKDGQQVAFQVEETVDGSNPNA